MFFRSSVCYFGASSSRFVSLSRSNDGFLGVITMNRPEARNAMSKQFIHELRDSVKQVKQDKTLRTVIFRSKVNNVFCAGADLKERKNMTPEEARDFVQSLRQSMHEIDTVKIPTIAAIDGAALGGGLELALACDFRTANPNAIVGVPETSLAIIPGAGGTVRLPRIVGLQNAKLLALTARKIKASAALKFGLIDVVKDVNCDTLPSEFDNPQEAYPELFQNDEKMDGYVLAVRLAREIVPNGPIGVQACKEALERGMQKASKEEAMVVERECYDRVLQTEDRLEALRAFAEKRKPVFQGK